MSKSNWTQGVLKSNYACEWDKEESYGYNAAWLGRFTGDWKDDLTEVIEFAEEKTWRSRNKNQDQEQYDMEEADLINAGMNKNQVILRKYFDVKGPFKKMVKATGLKDAQAVFHVQYPGEMLNLHFDKQYEYNEDEKKTARILIFLDDWQPGQFFQMGTSFLKWRSGDMYWFDWKNIPHATANAGWLPRPLLMVTGTISKKTKKLFIPDHNLTKV